MDPRRPLRWPRRRGLQVVSRLGLLVFLGAAVSSSAQDPPPRKPEDQVTSEEIEQLRREIEVETRSNLEILFGWNGESGDLNNQLRTLRYGVRLNLKRGPSTIELTMRRPVYETIEGFVEESGIGGAFGLKTKHSDRLESHFEVGVTRFGNETWSVTGFASFTMTPSAKGHYSLAFSRTQVEESILSVVGLFPTEGPFMEQWVGRVLDNRGTFSGSYRLPARFDINGEAALGLRTGENAGENFFVRAAGGVGWNAIAVAPFQRLSLLRLSAFGDLFGFSEDRLGYGGASLLDTNGQPIPLEALGSDGISPIPSEGNPGVGGYFSPDRYASVVFRIDVRGRLRPSVDYELAGFLGTQSFTGATRRSARGVSFTFHFRAGERMTIPLSYGWDNFGPFSQQRVLARLVVLL